MEPGGKAGGAARGQQLPGAPQDRVGGRRSVPVVRDLMFHFEPDLQEERRALKEDQKLCRSKAMKYLMETNRRRRAFEERLKEEEEKEQRFREQVLQQRKIKFQEATAKFQRAHQSFSQHKQTAVIPPVQTKAAFQLEEALEQIKGSVLTPGLCLPSTNKINFRTTDDASSTSAPRSDSFHQKQNSAMLGCDETVQESRRTDMDSHQLLFQKNLKEMRQLLEKQHLNNLENFHQEVKEIDDSESLMSFDSLEAGEQNGNCTIPNESSFATQCDCALYDPEKCQTRNNGLLHTDQSTSKNTHLNNCLRNVDLQHYHNIPIHDFLAKHNVLTPAEHVNTSEEKSSASHTSGKKAAEFSTSGVQKSSVSKAFSFLQNIKDRSKPSSGTASTSATGQPVFNPSRAWDSPDSVPGERVQDLMQDQSFKMTPQERTKSMQASSQPIATSVILFPNQGCSTGIPSTADTLPKDKNISTGVLKNTSGKITETKEINIKCMNDIISEASLFQDIPNASVLLEAKQQNSKEGGKGNIIETMSLLSDTEFSSDSPALDKILKNNILERKRAKLFRSILKKDSKCEPSHFKAMVTDHVISFGPQLMSSIRDSLELAKSKMKSAENEKYNRKLKWCDQIDQIIIENNEKCYEKSISKMSSSPLQCLQTANNAPNNNLNIVAQPISPMFLKNHHKSPHISKQNVNTEKSNKEYPSQNIFTSTGSFSAKKAWMVSKDEANKPSICGNNSKIKEGSQLKNKAKIFRSTSVRVQSRFMPKKRRGTVTQLQSAAEANKTQKAPGKLLTPHSPSTHLPGNRSVENTASPGRQSLLPPSLQATTASSSDFNDSHVVLANQVLNRNSAENSENTAGCAGLATAISTPNCSTAKYEPWAKKAYSVNNVQASACQDHSGTCTERRAVNTENGLHLRHIPAAGKTNTFCHGAHSARAPKDTATGVVPVTRQNQVFDNCENEHQALSECRTKSVVSKRKPSHHAQNSLSAVQLSPVQSAFGPVQKMKNIYKSEEVSSVSESIAQFLVAEKLASTPISEGEILAAMDHMEPASQPSLLNRAPCPGKSALSVEEQKIFQSLYCLNQKLQNVQEAITRNPFASHVLQISSP